MREGCTCVLPLCCFPALIVSLKSCLFDEFQLITAQLYAADFLLIIFLYSITFGEDIVCVTGAGKKEGVVKVKLHYGNHTKIEAEQFYYRSNPSINQFYPDRSFARYFVYSMMDCTCPNLTKLICSGFTFPPPKKMCACVLIHLLFNHLPVCIQSFITRPFFSIQCASQTDNNSVMQHMYPNDFYLFFFDKQTFLFDAIKWPMGFVFVTL